MRLFLLLAAITQVPAESVPSFGSSEGIHNVREDSTLLLPCKVRNLGGFAVVWKKLGAVDDTYLYVDDQPHTDDPRFMLSHPDDSVWDLIIKDVEAFDSGTYQCELTTTPELVQKHIVNVEVPPSVNLAPETNPYIVKPGDDVILTCYAQGNPLPNVTWKRKGQPLPDNHMFVESKSLKYNNVNTSYGGEYECSASNGVGQVAKETIELRVHPRNGEPEYEPWLRIPVDYVPAKLGSNVNISCHYDGNPAPVVDWFRDSHTISFGPQSNLMRYESRKHNYTEAILEIRSVTKDDYGDYTCRAHNNVGTKTGDVHVSGQPGPPEITVTDYDSTSISISWTLESREPVKEFKVSHRKANSEQWHKTILTASDNDKLSDSKWGSSHTFRNLSPGTEYVLQVQGKNSLGDGSLSLQPPTQMTDKSPAASDQAKPTKEAASQTSDRNDNQSGSSKRAHRGTECWGSLLTFCVICLLWR